MEGGIAAAQPTSKNAEIAAEMRRERAKNRGDELMDDDCSKVCVRQAVVQRFASSVKRLVWRDEPNFAMLVCPSNTQRLREGLLSSIQIGIK